MMKEEGGIPGVQRQMYIQGINEAFNNELAGLTEENADSVVLKLGTPSNTLLSVGIPYKEMRLYGNKLLKKAEIHGFSVNIIQGLPIYTQNPIAIFKGNHINSFSLLTEIKIGEYNTLVTLETNKQGEVDFNIVSSVYGKANDKITKWINGGKLLFVDKEKALNYVSTSAPIADATHNQELSSAAKIIKEFKNPKNNNHSVYYGSSNSFPEFDHSKIGPGEDVSTLFKVGAKKKDEYLRLLEKKRPDLSQRKRTAFITYLNTLDNNKRELLTFRWFLNGSVRLPEDQYVIDTAIKVADIAKVNPLEYSSPLELISHHQEIKIKGERINPDNVPTFSNKVEYSYGVTVYNVEDSQRAKDDLRLIIDSHWGVNANPWCIVYRDETGLIPQAADECWDSYSNIQRRVAFKDEKLLAFCANNADFVRWWDRNNLGSEGVPLVLKLQNDKLNRKASFLLNEHTNSLGEAYNIRKGDKAEGVYQEWYQNGKLRSKGEYENGKLVGHYQDWCPDGNLRQTIFVEEGNKVIKEWYADGGIRSEKSYFNDAKEGLWREWYADGVLKQEEVYHNNLLDGGKKKWYPNGNLQSQGEYSGELEIGKHCVYYEGGEVCRVWNYNLKIPGELHGEQCLFSKDNLVIKYEKYKYGRKDGSFLWFDKTGEVEKAEVWRDGREKMNFTAEQLRKKRILFIEKELCEVINDKKPGVLIARSLETNKIRYFTKKDMTKMKFKLST